MNGSDFVMASDGWSKIMPCGKFPHAGAGVVQVIDREACDRIAADFIGRKADANFPGVLVDFDNFSLDTGQSSEAAGWITDLEARDTGLWARVRWSERTLVSVALTNEPNIRGGRPLANRQVGVNSLATKEHKEHIDVDRLSLTANRANNTNERVENRWTDVSRAATLAVRRVKAAKRSAEVREFESALVEETREVSRKNAPRQVRERPETQRVETARDIVLRELAERRKRRSASLR